MIALIGCAAGGMVVLVSRRLNKTASEVEDLRAELAVVKEKRPLPPVVVHEVRTEAAPAAEPADKANSASSSEKAKWKTMTHAEKDQHLKLINETKTQVFSDTFNAEATDRAWSDVAARTIREKYSGPQFQALTLSAQCRSTLCKVEFSYSDPAAGREAIRQMTNLYPWQGTETFARFDLETKTGVFYIAREGATLPPVNVSLN